MDAGSKWTINGDLTVGKAGSAQIEVQTGGTLMIASPNVVIGELTGSIGDLTLSGGDVLSANRNLTVGANGGGSFSLFTNSNYTAGNITAGEGTGSTGDLNIDGGSQLQVSGIFIGGKQGTANINVTDGGSLTVLTQPLVLAQQPGSGATLNSNDAGSVVHTTSLYVGGDAVQPGDTAFVFTYTHGHIYVANTLQTWNAGTVNVSVGGGITVGDSSVAAADGVLRINTGGTLSGTGNIVGGVLNAAGTVAPGHSPGTLTVTGNYSQSAGGTLQIDVGGLRPGTQYDQLSVTGALTLGGTLQVCLTSGFTPVLGNSFEILEGVHSAVLSRIFS